MVAQTTVTGRTLVTSVAESERMVDWLDGDSFGIEDIDTKELRRNLLSTFKESEHEEDRDLQMEMGEAFVVGSVARNTASKGLSDVDIVIQFTSPIAGSMDPKFDLATTHVAKRMEDNWKDIATENMLKWVTGIDIITVKENNISSLISRFGKDTRTDESFESEYIYDIMKEEYYR